MPTIVKIGKLKLQIYADDHDPPHFHVITPERRCKMRIDNRTIFHGSLRRADLETATAWAREHQKELLDEWNRLNRR